MSLRSFSLVFLVTIAYFFVVNGDKVQLPAEIKTCKRNADDFSTCLTSAIQESWPFIIKGIPKLGTPILDPFLDEYNEFKFGSKEIRGKISTKDIYYYGLKSFEFLATRPEYTGDKFKLEIDILSPKGFVEGELNVNANLVNFILNGKSPFNISVDDIKITWDLSGSIKNDTWIIDKYLINAQIGDVKLWVDDIFNGSHELTKIVVDFVNEFWPSLYHEAFPFIQETWNKSYVPYVNNIFSKLSFDEVFPPS